MPSATKSENDGYTSEQLESIKRLGRIKDYYDLLGVSRNCSTDDVKKAYKRLALKFHPDKNQAPGSSEAFKSINLAFSVLSSPPERRRYEESQWEDDDAEDGCHNNNHHNKNHHNNNHNNDNHHKNHHHHNNSHNNHHKNEHHHSYQRFEDRYFDFFYSDRTFDEEFFESFFSNQNFRSRFKRDQGKPGCAKASQAQQQKQQNQKQQNQKQKQPSQQQQNNKTHPSHNTNNRNNKNQHCNNNNCNSSTDHNKCDSQKYNRDRKTNRNLLMQLTPVIFILTLSLFNALLTQQLPYTLLQNGKYTVRRHTSRFNIPFYTKENFKASELEVVERRIEEDRLQYLRSRCLQEKNERDIHLWRARLRNDRPSFLEAKEKVMTSCSKLQDLVVSF